MNCTAVNAHSANHDYRLFKHELAVIAADSVSSVCGKPSFVRPENVVRAFDFRSGGGLKRQQIAGVSLDVLQPDVVERHAWMLLRLDPFAAYFKDVAQWF